MRKEVINLSHDNLLSGHLGRKKTHEKVVKNFFWFEMRETTLVEGYCKPDWLDWSKAPSVSRPNPKDSAPAPAPAAELPEAALAPKSFTFDYLLDEDFSFLDPYLGGDAGTSVSSVVKPQAPQVDQLKDQSVEIERTVTSRTEKATPEVEKDLKSEVT